MQKHPPGENRKILMLSASLHQISSNVEPFRKCVIFKTAAKTPTPPSHHQFLAKRAEQSSSADFLQQISQSQNLRPAALKLKNAASRQSD